MQFLSLNPAENKISSTKQDVLPTWSNQTSEKSQIRQGMSPKEIANVISDHIIEIVRKQFEAKKRELEQASFD